MVRASPVRVRRPLTVWGATTLLLLVLQHVAARVVREDRYRPWPWRGVEWYLGGWSQFDGPRYLEIASTGYRYVPGVRSNIVWFPLYPLAVRALHVVVPNWLAAGLLVSAACGAGAAVVLWRWLAEQGMDGRTQGFALAACIFYPYAWYLYGVVHSDSMFLLLVVGAFLLVQLDRPVWAGLVGALATATRPTGMAVVPALVVHQWVHSGLLVVPDGATGLVARLGLPVRLVRERWSAAALAPFLSLAGLGAWMLYLGTQWGDPLAFKTNQTTYHPGDLPLLKMAFFVRWRDFTDNPTYALTIGLQAALVVVVLGSTVAVARRFGWGYGVLCVALVAIPTVSTEDFMGTGRYLIAAFPVWALWGERAAARVRGWVPVALSASLMVAMASGFSRSWYLT